MFWPGAGYLALPGHSFYFTCSLERQRQEHYDKGMSVSRWNRNSSKFGSNLAQMITPSFFFRPLKSRPAALIQTNWTTNGGTCTCFQADLARRSQQQHQLQTSSLFDQVAAASGGGEIPATAATQVFSARNVLPRRPKKRRRPPSVLNQDQPDRHYLVERKKKLPS